MIYIFIIVTVFFAVSWGNKLIQGVDSKADELSLRTMPLTLILLILILCLFGAKDWSAMHLFYVYPVTFWVGQFCLGLLLSPSVKEKDEYFDVVLRALPQKMTKKELADLLSGYEFFGESSFGQLCCDSEKWNFNNDFKPAFEQDLESVFSESTQVVSYRGHFRGQTVLVAAYYLDDKPALVGVTYLFDMDSHQGKMLDVYLHAMLACLSDFISKHFGKPTDHVWNVGGLFAALKPADGAAVVVMFDKSVIDMEL